MTSVEAIGPSNFRSVLGIFALIFLGMFSAAPRLHADTVQRGEQIFVQQCQSCHGENGAGGTDAYEAPLVGDASVGELATVIAETMPEEDPSQCVGDDAKAVAQYIHQTFYSEAARLRNRPPQRQLSRLTGTQLQQSLADLYQHFHGTPWRENKRGLNGSYFNAGRWKKEELKVERVDPVLDFDFGRESPVEGVEPKEFYIFWSGALRANHTGRYEIVVRSTCSFKLRFGTYDNVLINNHVQSEGKTEFRRTLNLISGRPYQIKIDFTQRKRKTEQPPATFSLRWVPPGGVETVIPPENLIPSSLPSSFALQTKLPPDDRSYGYDRGTRVDPQWDQAVTNAALEFGVAAEEELWPHYRKKHRKESDENRGRLRSFLEELVSIAFREPLDDATRKLYIDRQLDAAPDDGEAIRRVCLLTIKSPRFLYPLVDRDASQSQRVANRLSLVLHDSLPVDDWLLKQIEKGEFKLESGDGIEKIRQAAQKLANDPRLNGKAMEMFFDWLEIDPAAEIVKDPEKYDGFDAALQNGLRRSLERQVSDIFWSSESDYRELFLRDWTWTNPMLATFYGDQWKQSGEDSAEYEMVRSDSNPGKTFGVLTHPLVLSHLSYFDTTSPIHRGVFLIRRVLGRTLRPPNEAFTPINPDLHPDLTTRQRVELQTGEAKCQVCHEKINGLGFVLENYDTVGRFREFEKEKPIDATGSYVTRSGQRVTFNSVKDLAKFLAENKDAHRAFVERVFEHFAKQPLAAYGEDAADRLVSQFRKDFHMRHLIVEVAVLAATQPLIEEQQNGDQHESA